ncbi:hypothetical protein DFJ73DRAFT_846220 [Zopfochytrium polystomum]|nr:hypothetical protein DFJ73DRAFT_846220 [Zopfochytrium polystomum]
MRTVFVVGVCWMTMTGWTNVLVFSEVLLHTPDINFLFSPSLSCLSCSPFDTLGSSIFAMILALFFFSPPFLATQLRTNYKHTQSIAPSPHHAPSTCSWSFLSPQHFQGRRGPVPLVISSPLPFYLS